MGLSTKFINSTTLDLAKASRKYIYDGKAPKNAQTRLKLGQAGLLKPNGGIDIKKLAGVITEDLFEDGICDEKGVMKTELLKKALGPKLANISVKEALVKFIKGEF